MQFNSIPFLLFLTVVLAVDLLLRRGRLRKPFLLAASYFFYGSWDWRFLGLILLSTAVDWWAGGRLGRTTDRRARRLYLLASLGVNLGVLGLFKYFDFFIASFNRLLGADLPLAHLILPVGISFYTFQTLSYTIDVYRGRLRPCDSALDFALFVAFFPQLVAGPIVRAHDFLPQLRQNPRPTSASISWGLADVLAGLVKKVIIADTLGVHLVDPFFANPGAFSWDAALVALYGYAFQVYGDFAGYSQIAIGCGRLLGFRLPQNFNAPYTARSMRELWQRWHISLSTWLRDYLYIPMGGSRRGVPATYRNLMVTMLLGGLWHGAGWNFILWGGLHGILLSVSHYRARRRRDPAAGRRAGWVFRFRDQMVVFHLWVFTLVFFRSHDLETTWAVFASLCRGGSSLLHDQRVYAQLLLAAWIWHMLSPRLGPKVEQRFVRLWPEAQAVVAVLLLGLLAAMAVPDNPFIYFQF